MDKLTIKKIVLGRDDHITVVKKMLSWDKGYYSFSEIDQNNNQQLDLLSLSHDWYGIYQDKKLVGVTSIQLTTLPHYYYGIPSREDVILYPLVFSFVLDPNYDQIENKTKVMKQLEENIFPLYLYSDIEMHLSHVDQPMQSFLEENHFVLSSAKEEKTAIYRLGHSKIKEKTR